MLDKDDQSQPASTAEDGAVHLPWDVIEPPEGEIEATPTEAEPTASGEETSESEIPDFKSEIPDMKSETREPAAPIEPESPPRTIALTVLTSRTINLPILAESPRNNAEDEEADQPVGAESASVEPQVQPLPWSVAAAPDIIDAPIAPEADPQPPALAYAPAFLAVDDEGLPIPDEIADQLDVEIPSLPPETLEPEEIAAAEDHRVTPSGSGIWTIPLMCLGIAVLAACLIIPQADKNRRLAWEREGLRRNLEQLQKQVETNENFLDALATDRFLAKRLAQRQLNVVPAGSTILELDGIRGMNASPFQLVTIPPPPPLPEYQPIGGRFAELCRNPKTQLYLIGASLFAIAAGLVLGRDRPARA